MKAISENTFKNKMTEIFLELEASGEEVLVMEDGQMLLKLISYRKESVNSEEDNRQ